MNSCPTGKQCYPSPTAAWRVIQLLTRKASLRSHKQIGKGGGHAYHCENCGQWHMTTIRRREPLKGTPRPNREAQG